MRADGSATSITAATRVPAAVLRGGARWPASAVSSPISRCQSKPVGITSEPRGPPTPRYWPTCGLGRPCRGGAGLVHGEFDIEFARFAVVAARREIACDGPGLVLREHRTIRAGARHNRFVRAGGGEENLDVIVERRGDEVVQILAGKGDADQMRRQRLDALDLQQTEFQRMTDAGDREIGPVLA